MTGPLLAGVDAVASSGTVVASDAVVTIQAISTDDVVFALAQVGGLTVVATLLAMAAAFVFRWYANQQIPTGIGVLVGLTAVALYLNTRSALGEAIGGLETVSPTVVLFNVGAFAVAGFGSAAGGRVGDRLAVALVIERDPVEGGLDRVVRAVGRVITVELPSEVEDMVGYDPVSEETRQKLAGETFVFPRRLTVAELRERLINRLKADYDVGHVDVDVTQDGAVEYLAVGRRAAGIGPSLPQGTVALAVRADPSYAAGSGDAVQVWSGDGSRRRCNAEVRATSGAVVTLAVDAADAPKLDPEARYRLVTLSTDARPDREFASLLRAVDETLATIEIGAESPLVGTALRELGAMVVAIAPAGEERVRTLPGRAETLAGGDSIYVIASPDALRRIEGRAGATVSDPTADRVQ